MFKKTRRKIILSIMGALILLFGATLSVIMAASYREIRQKNTDMLERYVDLYYLEQRAGDPEEQEGNYLALRIDTPAEADEVITVELIGGTLGHPVTLDEDRNIILRISNKDTQSIEINATDGVNTVTRTLTLTGLKLISG